MSRTRDYLVALGIAVGLSVSTYVVALLAGWVSWETLNWLEVVAATINYGATYLCIKQRRVFYLLGVVASGIYFVVYSEAGLLASGVLSAYLVGTLLYGFFRWGRDNNTRPVKHLSWRWSPVYLAATAVIYVGAVILVQAFGGAFAFWDSAILVLTILAQLLLDQKKLESWWVWVAVNLIGVFLYWSSGLYFASAQQLIFLFINLWGWFAWRKTMVKV